MTHYFIIITLLHPINSCIKYRILTQKIVIRMLKRRKEQREPPPLLPFSRLAATANTLLSLCLMKATVLAESSLYLIFSPGSFCFSDVYRRESGRCRTRPFFLTFYFPFILTKNSEEASI